MLDWQDPHGINADLHCHSRASDGTLEPAELAARAAQQGVQIWALTDHDVLTGLPQAREAALDLGIVFVPGVEVSATWAGHTIHIVGLNVRYQDGPLADQLQQLSQLRQARARQMADGLAKVGINGAFEGAMQHVNNAALVGRLHFARHLVAQGVCEDVRTVFQRFLTPGNPGYVPTQWASLSDAVGWIRQAGGLAVIAHPSRYRFELNQMDVLLHEFARLGGSGVEVVVPSHSNQEYRAYARKSLALGLKASRGSDFHCPDESRVNLGDLPSLPDGCVPIWDNWHSFAFA